MYLQNGAIKKDTTRPAKNNKPLYNDVDGKILKTL